ncbi:MAG: aldo/keto reductase [Oscillospiraceae bacterium]|nr:aldo/keto reductase [Oscillospiraceae bacterium]
MEYRKINGTDSSPSLLGYGCMRFPEKDGKIDEEKSIAMLKDAVDGGVNYFDTAYIYHNGASESFIGRFLKEHSGLKRDEFYIATKLPTWEVNSLDDAKRIFAEQCERLQVETIDFYLLHDLKIDRFEKMEQLGVYDYCRELQRQGKIKHFGHSSHENSENFNKIINARDWDFVLLYLNYMDSNVGSDNYKMYEAATAKGIPVFCMEGIKGGSLANLPDNILTHFELIHPNDTPSAWALRWVGSLGNVKVILSGMSDKSQVKDNLKTLSGFVPLSDFEQDAIERVGVDLRKRVRNNCTGCNYCMPCPMGVNVPWCFSIWNTYGIYENRGHSNWEWGMVGKESLPSNCSECRKCMKICPQNIDIVSDLKKCQSELDGLKW